ncbi:sensor histidine kinase [Microbacterium sp. GXF0217]
MTNQTAHPAAPVAERPPTRLFLTILQLTALGVLGSIAFGILSGLFAASLGLVFVFGIGLVFFVGLVYALFGVAWFEVARVSSLYDLALPTLRWRPRTRPGFGGWVRSLGRQAIDGSMWRALANFALACLAGFLILRLFSAMVWSAITAFAPLALDGTVDGPFGSEILVAWAPVVGILGVVLSAGAIVGVAMLHRTISRALIVHSREAELTEQVRTTSAQREGAVRAADVERTRIERDLHDGVQPRLVSVGMTLGLAQQKIDDDPAQAKELIAEAHTSTKAAITELRQLARGIHASVLDDRGLDAALSALAGRSHIPVHLDIRMDGRCSRDAEAAVYFAIAESLTNAAKHSRASEARVIVRRRDNGVLWARVEDNGIGGAQIQPGGGLDGISNRVLAAGGTFRLDSPQGGPTSLEVSVPCAS